MQLLAKGPSSSQELQARQQRRDTTSPPEVPLSLHLQSMNSRMARILGLVILPETKSEMLQDILCQVLQPPLVALQPHLSQLRPQLRLSPVMRQVSQVRSTLQPPSLVPL